MLGFGARALWVVIHSFTRYFLSSGFTVQRRCFAIVPFVNGTWSLILF